MAAGRCDLVIEQGEDWTVQIVWSDYYDTPMQVTAPMRMTIKSQMGAVVKDLTIPSTPPPSGTVAEVSYNTESGLIQLHLDSSQTGAMSPGLYNYDLFVSVDDGGVYSGNQITRLIYGLVTVNVRYTATV